MPTNKGIPPQRLNIYHHNESLLFQFILYEYILSWQEMTRIEGYLQKAEPAEEWLYSLRSNLKVLIGAQNDSCCFFSWSRDDGILAKLNNYCAVLLRQCPTIQTHKLFTALHVHTERCWGFCIKIHQTIEDKPHREALQPVMWKAAMAFNKISALILKIVPEYKADENVVFFLLRYKNELQTIYGADILEKLFEKMYADGILEAERFLHQRYTVRGFTHLLPTISAKIAELSSLQPV